MNYTQCGSGIYNFAVLYTYPLNCRRFWAVHYRTKYMILIKQAILLFKIQILLLRTHLVAKDLHFMPYKPFDVLTAQKSTF